MILEDFCPGDTVSLRPCGGCGCWSRTLLCQGETYFGFLPPGDYVLTLRRSGVCLRLLVKLSPGSNAGIFCCLSRSGCRWRRDGWHYFFNRR